MKKKDETKKSRSTLGTLLSCDSLLNVAPSPKKKKQQRGISDTPKDNPEEDQIESNSSFAEAFPRKKDKENGLNSSQRRGKDPEKTMRRHRIADWSEPQRKLQWRQAKNVAMHSEERWTDIGATGT